MAIQYCKLCTLLLAEHFGEVVGKVADDLQWGPKQVTNIITSTGISEIKVKKAVSVLVQYGFATFEKSRIPWRAEYIYKPEKVLLLLRYPRYLSLIKTKFGVESELLLEEVLKLGNISESNAIVNVMTRVNEGGTKIKEVTVPILVRKFHSLITNQFLMRCANPDAEDNNGVPNLSVKESELYSPPPLNVKILCDVVEGKETTGDVGDKGIYWRMNYDRFHQDMRDEIMIDAMKRRFDENAAQLMRHLLTLMYLRTDPWMAESNPVPMVELKEHITKIPGNSHLTQYFEQYIKIMEEDSSQFIYRVGVGESVSSQICVKLAKAFHELTCTAIESVIEQRYGPKAARIFRLVRAKKYIEQEQIQQLAMISDKEAKQITYKLLQENFLQMQELRKPTVGSGPNKSFFLFHVDINLVVHTVTEMCHKSIYNALIRRRSERDNHKRLMDKQEKIETIAQSMREQGTEEEQIQELVNEWLAPPERKLLESVEKMMKKLQLAELQIDNTLFLLQLFSYYQYLTMPKIISRK